MTDVVGNKFAPGAHYGPVLSQTDLYLLKAELELNPLLTNSVPAFHLIFNLATGQTGGFNPAAPGERELAFTQKDEFATIPRVSQLILITELTPWCTIVKNEGGVTLGDICQTVWKEYSEHNITDAEFSSLPVRLQEQVKRAAMSRSVQPGAWGGYGYAPQQIPNRFKRYDWLRDKIFFDRMSKRDSYAKERLGFSAGNIFIMEFVA
ncbi:hypothetical protein VNI00_011056 [Paramarasmius palmivorus]|uniref:DUF6699 domain-containing protein n=1 Tax=Paramarasmius palmivorus TaxID=297713 RepID=A0AAW0CG14_9AGAR